MRKINIYYKIKHHYYDISKIVKLLQTQISTTNHVTHLLAFISGAWPFWASQPAPTMVTVSWLINKIQGRVKSGKFGHQVNSDTHLQTVEIQMRRLLMSRLIRIFTVCLVNFFYSNNWTMKQTSKEAVRI